MDEIQNPIVLLLNRVDGTKKPTQGEKLIGTCLKQSTPTP